MKGVSKLVDLIAEFPGIGPRQARRIVQFLLSRPQSLRVALARAITSLGDEVSPCSQCYRFDEIGAQGACALCADTKRDASALMVVERDVDIDAVESSSAYKGRYFVLGGLMPMARQKRAGKEPRTAELLVRIKKNGVTEVIFALSTTPEGDYTARELAKQLSAIDPVLKTTLLGRGLSVGAEIEYADSETLRNALQNRN